MDNLKLGHLIEPGREALRDAIHIAVAPAIAGERLDPGEHIGIGSDGKAWTSGDYANVVLIGIVDPYLKGRVREGQSFWCFLYPGSITSLRHEWAHPAFPLPPADATRVSALDPKALAETWLRQWAEDFHMSYGALIDAARKWLERGEHHTIGFDHPDRAHRDIAEFWRAYALVTGELVPAADAEYFFNCSC